MPQVEQIKQFIESLSREEFALLRKWFSEKDWGKWDKQIEEDSKVEKLDSLVNEARKEKQSGKLRDL